MVEGIFAWKDRITATKKETPKWTAPKRLDKFSY